MKPDQPVKYIRAKQLEEQYGIDRITAWRWSKDQTKAFPRAIRLAPNVSVFDKAEVDAWFESQKKSRNSNEVVAATCYLCVTYQKMTNNLVRKIRANRLKRLAPRAGLEPATKRLTAACSTN